MDFPAAWPSARALRMTVSKRIAAEKAEKEEADRLHRERYGDTEKGMCLNANLTSAKLENTSLEGARLCETTLPDGAAANGGC